MVYTEIIKLYIISIIISLNITVLFTNLWTRDSFIWGDGSGTRAVINALHIIKQRRAITNDQLDTSMLYNTELVTYDTYNITTK